MSNLSFVRHKGDGVTNQFALSVAGENIGYFRISDIHGYVDDKEVPITIDPNSPHIVRFTETPKLDADILIRRKMPVKNTYADFERGNNFGHRQVNNTFVQQLYLTQELLDGFFPSGFYFKQDVDLGGHKIVNLGDATEDNDAVSKKVTDSLDNRLVSLEQSVSGVSRFLTWSYNAVGGEDTLNPPYKFESARVFINGVRQRAGESFEVVGLTIMLAEHLEEGDRVDVELGTEPLDCTEADVAIKSITNAVSNLHTSHEAIELEGGLIVKDPLQLYLSKGKYYLPNPLEVPFTTKDSDANNTLFKEISCECKYPDFNFKGDFTKGCTVTSRLDIVKGTDGFYSYKGNYPHVVVPNSTPDSSWVYLGVLEGLSVFDPKNFGVVYNKKVNGIQGFQQCMDACSHLGGGVIYLDGFIYCEDTINVMAPDPDFVSVPHQYFFKAVDNVTIDSLRGFDAGFVAADGIVQKNHYIQYSKGYEFFTNLGEDVKNFTLQNFCFDYNGANNLLPPKTQGDYPQELAPAVWFTRGSNIKALNLLHKEAPGQWCVSFGRRTYDTKVCGNIFKSCGSFLAGNVNILDHSSVFCQSSTYEVKDNIGIGYVGGSYVPTYFGTFLECHSQFGLIQGNKCVGYGAGCILASFPNAQMFNTVHTGNVYLDVQVGIHYDAEKSTPIEVESHNNFVSLTSRKPSGVYSNYGHGCTPYQFAGASSSDTVKRVLHSTGNVFVQREVTGDWTEQHLFENNIFKGGFFTETYLDDKVFGFNSGYYLVVPYGKKFVCKDELYSCGYYNKHPEVDKMRTSLIIIDNVKSFTSKLDYLDIDVKMDRDCHYSVLQGNATPLTPMSVKYCVESVNYVGVFAGNGMGSTQNFRIDSHYSNIIEDKGMSSDTPVEGVITINNVETFTKIKGAELVWRYEGWCDNPVQPSSPRPFGDKNGDRKRVRNLTVGNYSEIVCVVSGVGSSAGTWAGSGKIESI